MCCACGCLETKQVLQKEGRAGMVWKYGKRPKAGSGEKMEFKPNGKQPPAGQGQKRAKNGFSRQFSIVSPFLGHFLGHFCPCLPGGRFPFGFLFFPHFWLSAVFHVSIPARHDPKSTCRCADKIQAKLKEGQRFATRTLRIQHVILAAHLHNETATEIFLN